MQMWLGVPWPYEVASPPHHFNLMCGIVESLMRGSGYFVSVSDFAWVNRLIVRRKSTSVRWASDS